MKYFFVLIISVIIFSCSQEITNESAPEGTLTEPEMISILEDIHLAEANLQQNKQKYSNSDSLIKAHYELIYSIHNTNDTTYKKSLEYYLTQPEQLKMMYETVISNLQEKEAKNKEDSK